MSRAALLLACALAVAACAPARARAEGAPADTTVEDYVRSLSDSTAAWFGLSAQPADTAGIDSSLAEHIAHPHAPKPQHVWRLAFAPSGAFNRALGPVYGASVATGAPIHAGRFTAGAQWAAGPDLWLGIGEYRLQRVNPVNNDGWKLRLSGGRDFSGLDRDGFAPALASVYALLWGADRTSYLRRDGVAATWSLARGTWHGSVGARDQRESPLATTATWTLFGDRRAIVARNDSAAAGRVHELSATLGTRIPHTTFSLEGRAWRAGDGLGGDFDYTRWLLASGGAVALGRHLAFAPEAAYTRLSGDALPQESPWLDGAELRTLDATRVQGTGTLAMHADLLMTESLQHVLGLERDPVFPILLGAFAGGAARWGFDPATGAPRTTAQDWPAPSAWQYEAGLSLLYRPGFPFPDSFVRLDWATPLGHDDRVSRYYVSFTRSLNFLAGR